MKKRIALVTSFVALTSHSAFASQTACTFSGGKEPRYFEIELIGYSDANPMVVFSSTEFSSGKRVVLQPADYVLEHFSQSDAAIDLAFRNPGNPSLPPSFSLRAGRDSHAQLKVGSTIVDGELRCGY